MAERNEHSYETAREEAQTTLEIWLENPNNDRDFREEIIKFREKDVDDVFDKYFVYKALKYGWAEAKDIIDKYKAEKRISKYKGEEADSCPLMELIYEKLWGDQYLKYCRKSGKRMTGETMNSSYGTLAEYLKISIEELPQKQKDEFIGRVKNVRWGNKKLFLLYYYDKDTMKELLKCAKEFLEVAYCIGNFIPVPAGCNNLRGTGPTKDYWDLALNDIYDWYEKNKGQLKAYKKWPRNRKLSHLLGTGAVLYQDWLAGFGCWDNFVIENYLQEYISDYSEKRTPHYGRPEKFWDGHSDVTPLPVTNTQCQVFFKEAADRIRKRSEQMVDALKYELETCKPPKEVAHDLDNRRRT